MKAGESDASVAKIEMLLFDNLGNLSGYPSELPRNRGEGYSVLIRQTKPVWKTRDG